MTATKYVIATRSWPNHAYSLPVNEVWNLPKPGPDMSDVRGEANHRGMWQILTSYKALVIADHERDVEHYGGYAKSIRVYGWRVLQNAKESGYDLEGRVSINGKKYRAFTTSVMFEYPSGQLVNVAAIYVCLDQPK